MQIDANTINMLLAQWYDYILHNPLNGVILAAVIAAVIVWLLLKIYYRTQLKKLGNRLTKEIAVKEQENVKLNDSITSLNQQLQQAEANLGAKNNQIAQIESAKQVLQVQVDQLTQVKALIAQAGQSLQTNFSLSDATTINAADDIDKVWQSYNGLTLELNNRLKLNEQKNFELQQLNLQSTAQLAEQELSLVALQESVKTQTAQLMQLRGDLEAQNVKLREHQVKQEADQLLIQQLNQKSNLAHILPESIQQPLETVVASIQHLEEPASKIIEQLSKVQEDAQTVVMEAVESVIDTGTEIVEEIADEIVETVAKEKEKGFKLFKSFKKTLHIGDKATAEVTATAAKSVSEPDIANEPILKKLEDEFKQFHEAVSDTLVSEPEQKVAKPSKLKGFFGKKDAPIVENTQPIEISSEASTKPSKLKSFFGKKKNVEESVDDTHQPSQSAEISTADEFKAEDKSGGMSKMKGFFGKKKAPVSEIIEEATHVIEDAAEEFREEKIYKSMADETREIAEKLGKLKGFFGKKK